MVAVSALFKKIRGAFHRSAYPTSTRTPVRLRILLAILLLVCVGVAASRIRTWRFERELLQMAEDIVTEINAEGPILPGTAAPGTETTCKVFASSRYVFFGPTTGKIVFLITPVCDEEHSTGQVRRACAICSGDATHELDYVYIRGNGGWEFQDSYMCRAPRGHR